MLQNKEKDFVVKYEVDPKAKNRPSKDGALLCLSSDLVSACIFQLNNSFRKTRPHPRCNVVGTDCKNSTNEKHGFQPYDTKKGLDS